MLLITGTLLFSFGMVSLFTSFSKNNHSSVGHTTTTVETTTATPTPDTMKAVEGASTTIEPTPAPQPVKSQSKVTINAPENCTKKVTGDDPEDTNQQDNSTNVSVDCPNSGTSSGSSSSVNVSNSNHQSVSSGSASSGGSSGSTSVSNSANTNINLH